MRLFVAISPPAAALDELEAAAAPLRALRDDLRWTGREAWHVTLAFLGGADEEALARLLPRLERAAQRHHRFSLALTGGGAFPGAARARVLWTGLTGDRRSLSRLAASAAAGARRAGAPARDEERPFRPHVTLARCRVPADVRGIVAALGGYQGRPWSAEEMLLIDSRPGEEPRFRTAGRWPLGPVPPVRTG